MKVLHVNTDKTELIEGLLARQGVDEVWLLSDGRPHESQWIGRPKCRVFRVKSLQNEPELRTFAQQMTPPDVVITGSERGVVAAAVLRSVWGLGGASIDTARNCTDKFRMKTVLQKCGIPVSPFALTPDPSWRKTVKKPRIGWGSRQTIVFSGQAPQFTGDDYFEQFLDIQREFHIDGFVLNGYVAFVSVAQYFVPPLKSQGRGNGSMILEGLPEVSPLRALTEEACHALRLEHTTFHLEILEDIHNQYFVGEIGLRPGGAYIPSLIQMKYGVSLWDAVLDVELGINPPTTPAIPDAAGAVLLPIRTGRITQMTSVKTLEGFRGVVSVRLFTNPGSVVKSSSFLSSDGSGFVLIRQSTLTEVRETITEILRQYVIETNQGESD